MSNTVLIRASRCIYSIPLDDWRTNWCPCLPKLDEWFVTIGEKYVVFEYGDICHRMDEHYFNTLLPRIPYSSRFKALRNGKGVLRTERSYEKKGVKKHEWHPD